MQLVQQYDRRSAPSGPIDQPEGIDVKTARLIRRKARQLAAHPAFNRDEAEDLEHDLVMILLERKRKYDPARGASVRTFASHVVHHGVASLLAARRAQRRDWRRRRSLDHASAATLVVPRPTDEQLDLALDLRVALSELPAELRALALLLAEEPSQMAVARASGLSRQNVRTCRRHIAAHLRRRHLAPISNQLRPARGR